MCSEKGLTKSGHLCNYILEWVNVVWINFKFDRINPEQSFFNQSIYISA